MPSMNTTPEEPTTTPPRTAPPVRIKQVVLPERPSTPTPIVTTAPPQEPLIEQPGDVLTPPQKRNIVATLLTSGPQAARLVLQNAASGSPESRDVTELTELLTSDALAPVGVAAVLNETVGTRIAIMLGSNKRYLEVKSVLGEQITADMFMAQSSSATKRPISFNVQQLDPMEQSRLLGAPTRPDRALAKFVLHMNAGDFVTARSLAAHCGPLAEACKAEADARIQVLVQ